MSNPLHHCPQCGTHIDSAINFCGGCGVDLRQFRQEPAPAPAPAPAAAPVKQQKKTMMGLPGMVPPKPAAAPEPQVSKQTMFGVPGMVGPEPSAAGGAVAAPAPVHAPAPVQAPAPAPVAAPAPAPVQAAAAAPVPAAAPAAAPEEAPRFQAPPPPRRRHEVSYSQPPPGPTSEFALPTREFPLKIALGIGAVALLIGLAVLGWRLFGGEGEGASVEAEVAPEAPLVPEPGLEYSTFAADPVAHRGRVVELSGSLYNVTSSGGTQSLQMLVDGCEPGQHCPVWVDFSGDEPAESGDRVRLVARIVGVQRFRVRGAEGEVSSVPKLTARALTRIEE